ncbi:hypothetical protein K435DRAFT_691240, partial [Dendrothele bispora CBS 962.96]
SVAQGDLQPYIQQAIDQVSYLYLSTVHLCSRHLRLWINRDLAQSQPLPRVAY